MSFHAEFSFGSYCVLSGYSQQERKQQIQLNQITQSLNEVMREQKIISERMAGHFTHVQMLVKRNAAVRTR